ncbi:hypothetical protein KKA85_11330, partial [bacterium]|nr:hypothetical protein [bacterium]
MYSRGSRVLVAAILTMWGCLSLVAPARADDYEIAPVTVRSAVIAKVLAFHKGLAGDVTVYVLGDPAFAEEFREVLGMAAGA